MYISLSIIIGLLVLYLFFAGAYQMFLAIAYFWLKKEPPTANHLQTEVKKFAVLVPAHNEELLISSFCESILNVNYQKDSFDVFIIADNCSDKTAEICREYPLTVLERFNKEEIGKGYALDWALQEIGTDKHDSFLILDADTTVDTEILSELNILLNNGEDAIQCYIDVPNKSETWFTRLIYLSRTINDLLYHYPKYRLGLSSYLMGTGMCFSSSLLKKITWNAYSLSEDWEYYANLVENGYRIGFSIKAIIHQQESNSLSQATSQRLRWASGRFYVLKTLGLKLLYKGIKNRDLVTADASLALLLPNWSLQINLLILTFLLSLLLAGTSIGLSYILILIFLFCLQGIIVMMGAFLTGNLYQTLKTVIFAPVFLVWKLVIDILCITKLYKGKEWIRTKRHLPK